jgi:protein required for attachment to host cells
MASYVLVADGGQARFLRAGGRPAARRLTDTEFLARPSLKLGVRGPATTTPGGALRRTRRSRVATVSAVPLNTTSDFDPHGSEITRFAKKVSRKLDQIRLEGGVDEFVLLVEPHFLGLLRKELTSVTRRLITREVALDLVHADAKRIEQAAFSSKR